MKGSKSVIDMLNEVLTAELTAVNQHSLHSNICKNCGLNKMAEKLNEDSIEEMKHAQLLIDRILFLDGLPNLQKLFPLNIGTTVKEQLSSDKALEDKAISRLKKFIHLCRLKNDIVSANLLEDILKSEEKHIDWVKAQLNDLKIVGSKNYISQQI